MSGITELPDRIIALSPSIRYVAVLRDGQVESKSKSRVLNTSSAETDLYEELLVNPTLLKLASLRGEIDCGGLRYLLVRYGKFFQFVLPARQGHVSVCIESKAEPLEIANRVESLVRKTLSSRAGICGGSTSIEGVDTSF